MKPKGNMGSEGWGDNDIDLEEGRCALKAAVSVSRLVPAKPAFKLTLASPVATAAATARKGCLKVGVTLQIKVKRKKSKKFKVMSSG